MKRPESDRQAVKGRNHRFGFLQEFSGKTANISLPTLIILWEARYANHVVTVTLLRFRGKSAGWLLRINHDHYHRFTPSAIISLCESPSFFGLSLFLALPWYSEATRPGTDTYRTRTMSHPYLGHCYSLPSTSLPEQEPTTQPLLWSCTLELGRNRSRPPTLRTRFIPLLGRTLRFSSRSLAPESSGLEIRASDTVLRTFTSMECLLGLWILGTKLRGGNNDCSGSTGSLAGDITSRS